MSKTGFKNLFLLILTKLTSLQKENTQLFTLLLRPFDKALFRISALLERDATVNGITGHL